MADPNYADSPSPATAPTPSPSRAVLSSDEELCRGRLLQLFAEMFTKEYMENNEAVRVRLVSQLTLTLEALYEVRRETLSPAPGKFSP